MEMFESTYATQVSIACFVSLVLVAAVSDVVSYRIPNVVIVMLLVLYPIFVVVSPSEVQWLHSAGIFVAVIAVGMVLYAFRTIGAGDIKLLAAVLMWAGPTLALPALLIGVIASGIVALIMLSNMRFVLASALSSLSKKSLGDKFLAKSMPWGIGLGVAGIFTGWGLLAGF